MNWDIYCKEGESRPLNLIQGNPKPEGFLKMDRARPSNFHICMDNGNGTGSWVIDKNKFSKTFIYFLKNRKKLNCLIKFINRTKNWYFAMLKYIPCLFIKNLFLLNDINKRITYSIFLFSFSIIMLTENNTVIQNIFISILAATFFNFFINIIPKELDKKKKAIKIGKIVGKLSELKNSQYINIGYLEDPWLNKNMYLELKDSAMTKEKAIKLKDFIKININKKKLSHVDNYIKVNTNNRSELTNKEYFNLSHKYFKLLLDELIELEVSLEFLKLSHALLDIKENQRRTFERIIEYDFRDDYDIGEYITKHFIYIEYIEYWYSKECLSYSEFYFGYLNYRLEYDKQFIQDANNIRQFTYF